MSIVNAPDPAGLRDAGPSAAAPALAVRNIPPKGRGVFSCRRFVRGELIERSPVIVMPLDQYTLLEQTALKDYYFDWGEHACAVPLGLSVLYNHSESPNAAVLRYLDLALVEFVALRDIEAGEEITHRYACPPWFEVVG